MKKPIEVVFAWEPLAKGLEDGLEDLIAINDDEVENTIPLDIDWPKYFMLERSGMFRGASARRGSKLIGYRGFIIAPPMRHKGSLWAVNEALFLDPKARDGLLAVRFINATDVMLKELGVNIVTQGDRKPFNSTAEKRRATFSDLLQRFCGYRPVETVHMKLL